MNIGRRSFLGLAAATGAAGCLSQPTPGGSQLAATASPTPPGGKDENLTVFVTDIHVSGLPDAFPKPCERLARFVDEVLAMNPRPARVVSLGDLAYLHGLPEDYAKSKPLLKKLADAGIELVFAMGNHDRRSAFKESWPEYVAKSLVPGRIVNIVSLGTADLVVLDGLQGSDERARTDAGPGQAKLFPDVFAWCKKELPKRERPFFVCAHWPIQEFTYPVKGKAKTADLAKWLVNHAPQCKGYLYGHLHRWRPDGSSARSACRRTVSGATSATPRSARAQTGRSARLSFATSTSRANPRRRRVRPPGKSRSRRPAASASRSSTTAAKGLNDATRQRG